MSKKIIIFTAVVLTLLFFLSSPFLHFSQQNSSKKPQYGGTLRVKSFLNTFNTELDPANPQSFVFISEHLYDGLVKLDKNLSPVPSLAEYWEISSDGKIYTFHLRRGVKFHHGRELTADDVKYSLERLININTNSPFHRFFTPKVVGAQEYRDGETEEIEGFKVRDKYTFEIHWIKPYVSCLYLLSMHFCKILPKELLSDRGSRFFSSPSGTGPFQWESWLRSPTLEIVGITLERNENYFGGRPFVKFLEFSPYFTLDHFVEKEIDITPVLSRRVLSEDYQIFKDGSLNLSFLGMSCNISPLDSKKIRMALSYGIDKSAIARAAFSFEYLYELTNNYIPAKLPGFFPLENKYGYNPVIAKRIIRDAGFSAENSFPTLILFLESPRTDIKLKIYREIRSQLDVLGIRLRLRFYDTPEEVKKTSEPYLVLVKRVMDFPDAENIVKPLFSSGSINNIFNYSNSDLESLLVQAESTKSWTKRKQFFRKMESILVSEIPALPLFTNQQRIAVQPYVRKVVVPLLGFHYLNASKIWLDK